jgi:hypothetical protein
MEKRLAPYRGRCRPYLCKYCLRLVDCREPGTADCSYQQIVNFAAMAVTDGICEFEKISKKYSS